MASSVESLRSATPWVAEPSSESRAERRAYWTLRLGAAACFVGHGGFGIITKAGWLPFFAVAGIGTEWAYRIMPLVGAHDVLLGLLVLWSPRRALLAWLAFWCTWTALLRPLVGMSPFEFLERAGNYGVPLAMLLCSAPAATFRDWFERLSHGVAASRVELVAWTLRLTVFSLLAGHGGLALGQTPLLLSHMAWLGFARPEIATFWSGVFELVLATAILIRPLPALLVVALGWKLGTELLFPLSGDWVFEFVERGGSYAAPLALIFLQRSSRARGGMES